MNMDIFSMFMFMSIYFINGHCSLCYECTSLNQHWCTKHFVNSDGAYYQNHVINCSSNCMKVTAHVGIQKHFYVRTCDVTGATPNTCQTGSFVLGIPVSTVCVCSDNRCNIASEVHSTLGLYLTLLIGQIINV